MKRHHLQPWLQLPSWKWNLLVLAVFAVAVFAYVSWQIQLNRDSFRRHTLEQAQLIAGILERNASQAREAQALYSDIIEAFLGSTANFLLSLDQIEAFQDRELAAFAWENGLTLISLQRSDGTQTGYPATWPDTVPKIKASGLHYLAEQHLFLFRFVDQQRRLTLALPARKLEELQQQLSHQRLLELLSGLPGMAYVRTESLPAGVQPLQIAMRETSEPPVAEVRLHWNSDQLLVVGLEAQLFAQRRQALLLELGGLTALLVVLGGLLSWLLYRQQQMMVRHAQYLERKLARQHEDAALGRAADSISHEIRNPLNAISMGLQRIDMEAGELENEHRELLQSMSRAVQRSSHIVAQLQRYSRPMEVVAEPLDFSELLRQSIQLYRPPAEQQQITISASLPPQLSIEGDSQLLQQLLENLLKNAVEAQPDGGHIDIALSEQEQSRLQLKITNQGAEAVAEDQLQSLVEPYVSSKTRGTGLGLPLVQKIVRAHQGSIQLAKPDNASFQVSLTLPTRRPTLAPSEATETVLDAYSSD